MGMKAHDGEAASLYTDIDLEYDEPIGYIQWTDEYGNTGDYTFAG